jgi:hypothetical protein
MGVAYGVIVMFELIVIASRETKKGLCRDYRTEPLVGLGRTNKGTWL